ncbi:MAG: adenosylcobinamide-phosphate synthase CbiB [Eubacterium sp.]|nr:adenosylcobinamide-phosphate synthase CbiB [Eubacterium sp.]
MEKIFIFQTAAILTGFTLDLLLGDPSWMPHPVRLIGKLIIKTEKIIRKYFKNLALGGFVLALVILMLSVFILLTILVLCYRINVWLGFSIESIACYQMLSTKCLKTESMKVYNSLREKNIVRAREDVSMIVGRDTKDLNSREIIMATVETVAENTSDGTVAPLFYMALFGSVGGFFYKAANTMDSMIGYKNEKYFKLGKFAAKLDDALNFIPSRLCAVLMIAAAFLLRFDFYNAYIIWRRDRLKHSSPNSAQTESVCAGALNIRLSGSSFYFGQLVKKPYIGDDNKKIDAEFIKKANKLLYITAFLSLVSFIFFRVVFWVLLWAR